MPDDTQKREANKRIVSEFYKTALFEGDVDKAIRLYGGETYTQHTPFAANGFDGLKNYVKWIVDKYPNTRGEIKRVFADNDHVILHCHYTGFFGKNGDAIIDIFRVEGRSKGTPFAHAATTTRNPQSGQRHERILRCPACKLEL
jgi:predicted SnoaL-like aldol condensation-catalyzing enzyme